MSDGEPTHDGQTTVTRLTKGREVEGKGKEVEGKTSISKKLLTGQTQSEKLDGKTYDEWRKELGIEIQPGWVSSDLKLAVELALQALKQKSTYP